MAKRELSSHAATAKALREYMKAKGYNGRARSESFAGGNSVTVKLFDPRPEEYQDMAAQCGAHQYGSFNGMIDMYEYTNGNPDIPQVKYCHCNAEYSAELKQKAWEYMRANFHGADEYPENLADVPSSARVFDNWHDTILYRVLNGSDGDFWSTMPKATPKGKKPANAKSGRNNAKVDEVTVREGTKPGYVEILFPEKPSEETRNELKANGFRWSRYNGVWWGKADNLPASYQN